MAKLSSLIVDLQVESAQLRAGLDVANKKLDDLGKKAKGIGQVFDVALAKEAVQGLASFVQGGAEMADNMGKLAQSVGAPVEGLSKLAYAADLSDVSSQELGNSLGVLSKNMSQALEGGDKQSAIFKGLGISITDASGKMRSSTDVFDDVRKAFSGMEDGAAKTALAQELFGKSGKDLIPLLNQSNEEMAKMGDEAERFGLVVTEDAAKGANEFNDSLTKLRKVGEGLAMKVAAAVAPAITGLANDLIEAGKKSGVFEGAVTTLTAVMKGLATGGAIVGAIFNAVGQALGFVASAVVSALEGNWKGIGEAADQFGKEFMDSMKGTAERVTKIWDDSKGPGDHMEKQAVKAKTSGDKVVKAIKGIEDANKKAEKAQEDAEKAFEQSMKDFQKRNEEVAQGKVNVAKGKANVAADVASHKGVGPSGFAAGFGTFDEALARAAESFNQEIDLREKARIAVLDGDYATAKSATEAAEALHGTGESAVHAADAMRQAMEGLQNKVAGRIGNLGGVIESAKMGAEAGGVWGAVAAVGIDLLSQSQQFQSIVGSLDGFLQYVADALGTLLGPTLEALGPLLDWIAGLFKALEPVFQFLGAVLGGIVDIITGIVNGIAMAWNSIIDAIDWALGWLGVDLSGMKWNLIDLKKATDDQTKASEKAGDALTNVPQGYKVALSRFDALSAEATRTAASTSNQSVVYHNNIVVNAQNLAADDVLTAMEERVQRSTGRSGSTIFGSRYARQEY